MNLFCNSDDVVVVVDVVGNDDEVVDVVVNDDVVDVDVVVNDDVVVVVVVVVVSDDIVVDWNNRRCNPRYHYNFKDMIIPSETIITTTTTSSSSSSSSPLVGIHSNPISYRHLPSPRQSHLSDAPGKFESNPPRAGRQWILLITGASNNYLCRERWWEKSERMPNKRWTLERRNTQRNIAGYREADIGTYQFLEGRPSGCTEVKKKNLKKGKEDGWSNGFQSIDPTDWSTFLMAVRWWLFKEFLNPPISLLPPPWVTSAVEAFQLNSDTRRLCILSRYGWFDSLRPFT